MYEKLKYKNIHRYIIYIKLSNNNPLISKSY